MEDCRSQKSRDAVENRLKAAFLLYRHVSRHYQRHVTLRRGVL